MISLSRPVVLESFDSFVIAYRLGCDESLNTCFFQARYLKSILKPLNV